MLHDANDNQAQFRLSVSADLARLLTGWARDSRCDRAEILRKALTLYAVAAEAEMAGDQMAIVSENGRVLRRIDGVV